MARFARRAFCLVVLLGGAARAAPVERPFIEHARIDRSLDSYEVQADLTFVLTSTRDQTLLTRRGLNENERTVRSFYPSSQRLEMVEAWVDQPDGTRLPVMPANVFTRPSAAAQGAPGFSGAMTTTVLFPQLRVGSRTHVVWRLMQRTPPLLGFNVWDEPAFDVSTVENSVDITLPESVPLTWTQRGGYTVTDTRDGPTRHIHAALDHTEGQEREPNMLATSDFLPVFLATSLPDWKAIGAIYAAQSRSRLVVTPEISEQAAAIVGAADGLEAARLVYDWVAGHIRYVAVFVDPNDGYVPHAADAVLQAGYGDCKDHVILMQALLAARGIEVQAALIDWGSRTRDLPLVHPGQFNHVIAYLPQWDVYANPTNPNATFAALDRRLADKMVVIAGFEGRVARTPRARAEANRYRFDSHVALLPDGTLEGSARLSTQANLDSSVRAMLAGAPSPRYLAEMVLSSTAEGGFGTFRTTDPSDLETPLDVVATWTSPHGVNFQGGRAYMALPAGPDLRPPRSLRSYLMPSGKRRQAMAVGTGSFEWNIGLALPDGVTAVELPPDVALVNEAGRFEATYARVAGGVRAHRMLTLTQDKISADGYTELAALLYAPIADSRAAVVLERGDAAVR